MAIEIAAEDGARLADRWSVASVWGFTDLAGRKIEAREFLVSRISRGIHVVAMERTSRSAISALA